MEDGCRKNKVENYAISLNKDWLPANYDSTVDEKLLNIKFKPDIFQKQAFYFLCRHESVFVSAHTSSGKTLVAEYAISLAQKSESRVIYTSPIKALSNQKFYDFKNKFPDVGLITGDVQVNPFAKCLIMTTEILRNLVYKNSDILCDTEFVIFDEVHYINDAERGVVWEETIIMLPRHISLVMLSATIPNALEFAQWVGRTKDRCIYVISTLTRAVPLEFAVYCDAEAYTLEDKSSNKNRVPQPSNFREELTHFSKKSKILNRFRINDLGNYINNRRLIPAIFFTFSKRTCEEYGRSLQLLDLTTPFEKESITKFLEIATANLREEDKNLPQVRNMMAQVYRGVGVHHGALLPFVKECVELLFSENLIKILVATETFAMGVNMPAKCCVFLGLTKYDNGSFRYLNTGEFIQMSGRAGRRGMDKVGTVLIADQKMPSLAVIKKIISGVQLDLISKFRLSFSLILMALRSNVDIEELMRNSYRENSSLKNLHSDMVRLSKLDSIQLLHCEMCTDYFDFFETLNFIVLENKNFLKNNLTIGSTCVLKNNQVVVIEAIKQDQIFFANFDKDVVGDLFSTPMQDDVSFNGPKSYFKYPLKYRNICDMKTGSLEEDVIFLLKEGQVSFDYDEMNIHNISKISKIKEAFDLLCSYSCLRCDKLDTHYYEGIKSKAVKDEIVAIKNKYSSQSLKEMNEFLARMKFLKRYGFYDESITLKGRAAAEIVTLNEVLAVELIFNNEFESFSPSELISVLSAMVFEEPVDEYVISDELKDKTLIVQDYFDRLSKDIEIFEIPPFKPLNFAMAQAVYDWCQGLNLGSIVAKHKVAEGTFVRLILRMDECTREMIAVSSLILDENLSEKFRNASALMTRDIVFLPSLYI